MQVKKYQYNDDELVNAIKYLCGSEEYFEEHGVHLVRNKNKTFYVLFENDTFVGVLSIKNRTIGDCHIVPDFRNKGYMQHLLTEAMQDHGALKYIAGTRSPAMEHIFTKSGFTYQSSKGQYKWLEKE